MSLCPPCACCTMYECTYSFHRCKHASPHVCGVSVSVFMHMYIYVCVCLRVIHHVHASVCLLLLLRMTFCGPERPWNAPFHMCRARMASSAGFAGPTQPPAAATATAASVGVGGASHSAARPHYLRNQDDWNSVNRQKLIPQYHHHHMQQQQQQSQPQAVYQPPSAATSQPSSSAMSGIDMAESGWKLCSTPDVLPFVVLWERCHEQGARVCFFGG